MIRFNVKLNLGCFIMNFILQFFKLILINLMEYVLKKNLTCLIVFWILVFSTFSCSQSVSSSATTSDTASSGVVIVVKPNSAVITGQPQSFSVNAGKTFSLTCFAKTEDSGVLSYQWYSFES